MTNAEIIIYSADHDSSRIEVRVEDETIWLTQSQIVNLFSSSKANVSEHIKQIYLSKELETEATVRKFRIVQIEGSRSVTRSIDHYNLDMIISIGYRVNSIRGTQFRIWANRVLKEYLLKGYVVNQRLERLEHKIVEHDQKFDLLIVSEHIKQIYLSKELESGATVRNFRPIQEALIKAETYELI